MNNETLAAWIMVGALWLFVLGFLGWMAWMNRKMRIRKQHRDSRGCYLWEIDTGESTWVAAPSREDAIKWYFEAFGPDLDGDEDLDDCCSQKPCLLATEHYSDLSAPSEGKITFRETMEQHHARLGSIPFMVSTTCG